MSKVSKEKRKRSTSLFWKYLKFWPFDEPNSFWRFRSEISQFTESLYNLAKPRAIRPPRNSGLEFLFHSQELRSRILFPFQETHVRLEYRILFNPPKTQVYRQDSYTIPRNKEERFLFITRNSEIESWFLFHSNELLFHSNELRSRIKKLIPFQGAHIRNHNSFSIPMDSRWDLICVLRALVEI